MRPSASRLGSDEVEVVGAMARSFSKGRAVDASATAFSACVGLRLGLGLGLGVRVTWGGDGAVLARVDARRVGICAKEGDGDRVVDA